MDLRRLAMVGLLLATLGFVLFTSPLTKGLFQKKPPVAPARVQVPLQAQAPSAREEPPRLSQEELARWRRRYDQVWSRDPFFTAEEELALRTGKTPPAPASPPSSTPLPSYTVKVVLISGASKIAAIDGLLVSEGDLLGEERVVEIQPEWVMLERAGQRRRITVVGGDISIVEVKPRVRERSENR